jgi:preprotein translocase subunit SecA
MNTIWSDFARMIFHVEVEIEGDNGAPPEQQYTPSGSQTRSGRVSYSGGIDSGASALAQAAAGEPGEYAEDDEPAPVIEQRRVAAVEQIGRNDPCWCGSGKKFKKCHGA